MSDEDRWGRVRQIIREEVDAANQRLLAEVENLVGQIKNAAKPKLEMVNGKWLGITAGQREAWNAAYGAVDIDGELLKAASWIVSNPSLAPKSNFARFLNTWLTREQNRLSLRAIPIGSKESRTQQLCGYCGRAPVGSVNGIHYCDAHSLDAMDMKPRRMLGVVAKPVAGRD